MTDVDDVTGAATPTGLAEREDAVGRVWPTSSAQRRLWFADRLDPNGAAYHVPVTARLRGALDVAALRRALTGVVARHQVLRSAFRGVDGEPVQVVGPTVDVPLPVRDVDPEDADAVDAAMQSHAVEPFDLATGPPLRCALLRLRAREHLLLVTFHHIVVDGWSLGLFFRDLTALYRAHVEHLPADLPDLPVQYGEVTARQRRSAQAGALTVDVDYWRTALAGAPASLDLPTEHPRPAGLSGPAALRSATLPAGVNEDVDELCQTEGVTAFVVLLAAFAALLARYSTGTDVVVGTPVAGRLSADVEPLIGCFINTLPLRVDLSGEPAFRDLLARVRSVVLDGYDHQRLSFEQIVDAVRPGRVPGRQPLVQVMFSVINAPPPRVSTEQLGVEFVPTGRGATTFDLNVTVGHWGGRTEVSVEYRADLFGPDWIDRMIGHYRTVLAAAVADPERPVTELPLLTAAERRTLDRWNDTGAAFPDQVQVQWLVERQARDTPDAVAVVDGDRRVTCRELDAWANRIAHRLRGLGVGPGARVGLCLTRSAELVAGLLGVLKAGAAFVPLDPDHPDARLALLTADAGVWVVLTHGPVRDRVPAGVSDVVELDSGSAAGSVDAVESPGPPESAGSADDDAYVIYTSGSTGQPKGVATTHRAIVNRLVWMQREYQLDGTDAVLQKTPYSFDVSVWEFLWPLLCGARLVMARPGGHRDPTYLRDLIVAERVTTVHFVPSMLAALLDTVDVSACTSLRRLICSGEALPTDLARRFLDTGLPCTLHNLYGPTEAAVDVSHWTCSSDEQGATVPIGHPISNVRLYVLDGRGNPMPIGVAGELHIGGVQVARGYLHRPELTAQRFVPDPFAGGMMYRTGDVARWRPDGAVEFLGRLDHQVKLRGFRIELGEVEAALRAQQGVRDAVTLVRGERLVGYLVGDGVGGRDRADTERVRAGVARTLPSYMVPAGLVWVDAIPLTPNGKVDRAALPDPAVGAGDPARVAARDGLELELVALWEEVLGVRPVGVTDDFFDLGGNSLQVIRLLGRISQQHGRDLPVSVMFSGGATVERLARELRRDQRARTWSPVVTVRPGGARPPLFCLPPAVGNALSYLDLARHLPADQPVYGLQAPGLDAGQRPVRRLEDVAEIYLEAIRTVCPTGPYHLAGYCVGSMTAFAVAQRLRSVGEPVALLAVLDGGPPAAGTSLDDADEADMAVWFAWELGRAANRRLVIDPDRLRGLSGPALAEAVLADAVASQVLPPDTAAGQLSRLLSTFDAGARAARDYRPQPFDGPILAFRAAEEPIASSPVPRWKPLAGGGLAIVEVPGDHYTMMRPPHVPVLARELDLALTRLADQGAR